MGLTCLLHRRSFPLYICPVTVGGPARHVYAPLCCMHSHDISCVLLVCSSARLQKRMPPLEYNIRPSNVFVARNRMTFNVLSTSVCEIAEAMLSCGGVRETTNKSRLCGLCLASRKAGAMPLPCLEERLKFFIPALSSKYVHA